MQTLYLRMSTHRVGEQFKKCVWIKIPLNFYWFLLFLYSLEKRAENSFTKLWVIKTKSIFWNNLMINKLYTLHLRRKKAFSSFMKICLRNFFHFLLKIFAWFFLIVWCKNKKNLSAQCLTIVILLYLKWSSIIQGTCFFNNWDKNVMIYVTFLLV